MKHNESKSTLVTRANHSDRIALHDDIDNFSDANAFRDDSGVDRIISAIDGDAERRDAEEQQRHEYLTRQIKIALKHLTPRQREYINLSFFENMRDCEIQALWGCKHQTITDVKHAAMKKLKKSFQKVPAYPPPFPGILRRDNQCLIQST